MSNSIALCIPAYNAEKYLPRLLTSANNQTVPFTEILVYNDCSTDNTEIVARNLGAEVVNGDINRGCSYGKNQLAKIAKSDWLHFHDADDDLYPSFVETASKWINKPDCPDVVLFAYEIRDNETNEFLGIRKFDYKKLLEDPIEYSILEQINPFCGLYNKNKFLETGGYDLDPLVLFNEDVAMHIRLARKKLRFGAEEKVTIINYFVSTSMSSSNRLKCIQSHYHVLRKTSKKVDKQYYRAISKELSITAGILASYSDWEYAYRAINLALRLDKKSAINNGSKSFKLISKIDPYLALRIREYFIRLFKPHLRKSH